MDPLKTHSMHHRTQTMNMLRQLGVMLEDIDFNEFLNQRLPL